MRTLQSGFTLVELATVIVIMAILVSIALVIPLQISPSANDSERADDTASIARRLEQAYSNQDAGGPVYPTTTKLLTDVSSLSGTVSGIDSDALKAPGSSTSSVIAATSNSLTSPMGSSGIILNQYVYQPLTSSGALCTNTGTDTCVRFFMYYKQELSGTIITIKSIHQQ